MIAGEFFLPGLNLTALYARAMKATEYRLKPSDFDDMSLVRLKMLFDEGGGIDLSLGDAIQRENDRRARLGLAPVPELPKGKVAG